MGSLVFGPDTDFGSTKFFSTPANGKRLFTCQYDPRNAELIQVERPPTITYVEALEFRTILTIVHGSICPYTIYVCDDELRPQTHAKKFF